MPPYNTRSENQQRHNPHAEITEYKQSLRDFVSAWGRLTEAWEKLEFAGANVPDDGTKGYPFAESFDDLYHSVIEWAENIESQDDPKSWNVAPDVQPITSSDKQAALDAAEQFGVRANGARVKKAALDIVATWEDGQHLPDCPRPERTRCNEKDPDICCGGGKDHPCDCADCHPKQPQEYHGASLKNAAPPDPELPLEEEEEPVAPPLEPEPAPPSQPEEPKVERSEPATEATPLAAPPAEVTPLPAEATVVPKADDDPITGELAIRAEVEAELGNQSTIEAVMKFLKEQKFIDSHGLTVKEGVWNWSEASDFATVSFGEYTEYMIAPSEEAADDLARAMVRQQLEDEPELFTQNWLEGYIDTERLRDSLSSDVEEMIRESPDSYGWKRGMEDEDVTRYDEEGNEDPDGEYDEDGQLIDEDLMVKDEPSDEWIEAKVGEILIDPLDYLRDIYGDETMKKAMEIAGINIDDATDDAISMDGAGHFLSSYDGQLHDLPGGGVWWRHN